MTGWRWTSVAACQVSRSVVPQRSRPAPGLAYSPGEDHKTVIRAGAGLFYSRVPLLAADFLDNPTRVASFYDETGSLVQPPVVFQNAYVARAPGGGFVAVSRNLDTSPRNFAGNFEVDRELRRGMVIRASYLYSQTRDLYLVTPVPGVPGGSLSARAGQYRRLAL